MNTLVGLPRPPQLEEDTIPLCNAKRSGIRWPALESSPRDMRGLTGSVPVHIPPARRVRRARAPMRSQLEPLSASHLVAALLVMAIVAWIVRIL